ncbi:uncharacterized protein F5891DRAFT_1200708 [Suillus fuscotomentosus]|uniref:Uncharacterized protein n=1 Tax=Suillus fuscotomentosus TaxID=1912939 RepID=A0AAD4DNK8_9AGAM|nr:uncharacterized protein F5891DRAFT_1200708 [Suillus fuscotomentosus]KAG1886820.1 hypothetical protein F5891DRAFT_1200708 [Suillus fuscotomentosus]
MPRCGPKTWTTPEEEAFLHSQLPGYIACQATKVYHNFWNTTIREFLSRWPERARLTDIPQEGELSDIQKSHMAQAILKRKSAIKNWFRWRTNVAHLARSGRSGGVLRLDTILAGDEMRGTRAPQEVEIYSHIHYEGRVKADADALIASETITSRGDKLLMRRIVTRDKYSKEPEEIKAEVRRRHQVALEKWRQTRKWNKAGIMEEVNEETKIKAFLELGGHLDRVFRHLSHKTGGLKFTCIAGGRNPVTGEAVVLDFHLGDTEDGADFSAHYPKFSEVQAAYATFVNEALTHDDNMEALARADDISDRRSGVEEAEGRDNIQDSEDKVEDGRDIQSDEEESQNDSYNVVQEGNTTSDLTTPSKLIAFDYSLMDDISAVPSVPSTPIHDIIQGDNTIIKYPQIPAAFSMADFAEFDRLLATITKQDLDSLNFPPLAPHLEVSSFSPGPGSELDDFLFSSTVGSEGSDGDFNFSLSDSDFEMFLPHSSPILGETLTSLNPDITTLKIPVPVHTPSAPQALVHQSLAPQSDLDGPRRTLRRHVPSKRDQALNAIGSSKSRICPAVENGSGKENVSSESASGMKRKAATAISAMNKKKRRP